MKTEKITTSNNSIFEGPLLIYPKVFNDERGYFYESWNENSFNNCLQEEIKFVQDNQSSSSLGVLRGLHYQLKPKQQGKLVRATFGSIYDVIVDLRKSSPTYGIWAGIELSANKKNTLWVPDGFAHGFLSLSNNVEVQYKVTKYWDKEFERSLRWDDPDLSIDWPIKSMAIKSPIISNKDAKAPTLKEIEAREDYFR